MDPTLLVTGLAVGLLVGLTGVGGGAVMTPALIIYGIPPAVAVGTDLVYAAITKSVGVVLYQARGKSKWSLVLTLAVGSLPAAWATLWLLGRFRDRGVAYDSVITGILGLALMLTAVVVVTKSAVRRLPAPSAGWVRVVVTIASGCVLGVLVAASSVGAGALGAAVLLVLHRRLATVEVVGTDLAHAVVLAGIAGLGHLKMGTCSVSGSLWVNSPGARETGIEASIPRFRGGHEDKGNAVAGLCGADS